MQRQDELGAGNRDLERLQHLAGSVDGMLGTAGYA
ncbi:hypothetical protein FHT09_003948 [Xanthomonas arboricola]|nr:hypothetical protein [Xanthomonas sp. CFBP 8152]